MVTERAQPGSRGASDPIADVLRERRRRGSAARAGGEGRPRASSARAGRERRRRGPASVAEVGFGNHNAACTHSWINAAAQDSSVEITARCTLIEAFASEGFVIKPSDGGPAR